MRDVSRLPVRDERSSVVRVSAHRFAVNLVSYMRLNRRFKTAGALTAPLAEYCEK
jgi:hypothetical protein